MTKNITNGEFDLDVDADDRVNENFKFMRIPGGDAYDQLRRYNPNIDTTYHIESNYPYHQDIRTGSFSQISEKYKI